MQIRKRSLQARGYPRARIKAAVGSRESKSSSDNFFASKYGPIIVSFILTGILGALITTGLSQLQSEREAARADREAQEANLNELQRYVSEELNGRLVQAGLFSSALSYNNASLIDRRLESYEESYISSNRLFFRFSRVAEDLKQIRFSPRDHISWVVEENIVPSFARIDLCVTQAYSKYQAGQLGYREPFPYVVGENEKTLACGRASDDSIWTMQTETRALNSCLATFRNELDGRIYLRRQLVRHDEGKSSKCKAGDWDCWEEVTCQRGSEWDCWLNKNWVALPKKFANGCSNLAEDIYTQHDYDTGVTR